jgi:DNA-directed RNA polymerase alpha subunit
MITEEEYLQACLLIIQYKKQQKEYNDSVKKDLNIKFFEPRKYNLDSVLGDCDLSVGTINCLKNLDFGYETKLSECIGLEKSKLLRIRCFGIKRVSEFEKLLNSVGIFLL